ncbi:MAG: hypothetical protein ABI615_08255 [Chthoniobacterales bacterium]
MITLQAKTGATSSRSEEPGNLTPLEIEAIDLFISFLRIVGLPKSVGEIYGLLFASSRPLAMDELIARLHISTGAASQGLKLLRELGAVKTIYTPGARKDHYTADLELSRFATVFIKEELQPRLGRGLERVRRMEELLAEFPESEQKAASERLTKLRHWLEKGDTMLPWIIEFLKA